MKRGYYNLLAAAALVVMVFCFFSGFSAKDPREAAKALVVQRAKILRSASSGAIPDTEAEKQLRQIEGEGLLSKDLKELRSGLPPERSCSVKVREIEQKKKLFCYTTYQAEILWDSGNTVSGGIYNLVIKENNGEYILTILEMAKL